MIFYQNVTYIWNLTVQMRQGQYCSSSFNSSFVGCLNCCIYFFISLTALNRPYIQCKIINRKNKSPHIGLKRGGKPAPRRTASSFSVALRYQGLIAARWTTTVSLCAPRRSLPPPRENKYIKYITMLPHILSECTMRTDL